MNQAVFRTSRQIADALEADSLLLDPPGQDLLARKLELASRTDLVFSESTGTWHVFGHAPAAAILKNREFTLPDVLAALTEVERAAGISAPCYRSTWRHSAFQKSGDAHRDTREKMRRTLALGEGSSIDSSVRPKLEEWMRCQTKLLSDRRSFDMVSELAVPLACHCMSDIAGIPVQPIDKWSDWVSNLIWFPESVQSTSRLLSLNRILQEIKQTFSTYPNPNLEDDSEWLTVGLFVSGVTTLAPTLARLFHAVVARDDLQPLLKRWDGAAPRPSLIREIVRHCGASTLMFRSAPVGGSSLEGCSFEPGQGVAIHIDAANRDTRVFPSGQRFCGEGCDAAILSFGAGPHYCVGQQLTAAIVADVLDCSDLRALLSDLEITEQSQYLSKSLSAWKVLQARNKKISKP